MSVDTTKWWVYDLCSTTSYKELKMNAMKKIDFIEDQILILVKHFGLEGFIVGLHNASAHGKIFQEANLDHLLDDEDEHLLAWFKNIDSLKKLSKDN